jgi:hypothetical protein
MTKTQNRPLSKTQRDVIDLMKNGWQLATNGGIDGGAWIQKGGAGRGGESKTVNMQTVHGLYLRGVIRQAGKGPGIGHVYALTEKANGL